MRLKYFLPLFALLLIFTGCNGGKVNSVKIEAKPTPIDTFKIARQVFNKKASQMQMPIKWVKGDEITIENIELTDDGKAKYNITEETTSIPPSLKTDIASIKKYLASDRDTLIKKVLKAKKDYNTNFDLSSLPTPYQPIAKKLLKIAPHIRHLFQLQTSRDFDEYAKKIKATGNEEAVKLLERNSEPTCGMFAGKEFLGDRSEECALIASYPDNECGRSMWPDGMNKEIFEELKANASKNGNPQEDPFLSPFTSVYWADKNKTKLAWRTFYNDPLFHKDLEAIVKLLNEAAKIGEDENKKAGSEVVNAGFIAQLKAQANALKSDKPYPYKDSDAAWMKAGGPLKLCMGPYESYEDKDFETKAFFQYILAMEDEKKTEEVKKLITYKQKLEEMVAKIINLGSYKARSLEGHDTATPFIKVIKAEGDMKNGNPTAIAHNLPNLFRDQIGFIIETFSNHYAAKKAILEDIAAIVIIPEQQKYIDFNAFIDNGHYHELTHAVGPNGDFVITSPNGAKTTVNSALGDTYSAIEETKADTGMVLFSEMVYGRDSEKYKKDVVTAIASLFRSSRFGLDSHGQAGLTRLAFFIDSGAIEYNNGRFKVDFNKVYDASVELMNKVGTIEATGDKKEAERFLKVYVAKGNKILDEVKANIEAANIPIDVDIHYNVAGM